MSATNTTTNYSLPIFIGSDKPAWLVDFNGAMNAIDAQMKVNADAIATKSPILTFNDTADIDFTKSGNTITANLSDGVAGTVSRALVRPVSAPASQQIASVDTANAQQMITVGSGLDLTNNTLTAVDLNLTDMGTATLSLSGGAGTLAGGLSYAFNSDHSIGKIYGNVNAVGTAANIDYTITTDLQVAADEAFEIYGLGQGFIGLTPVQNLFSPGLSVDANGNVSIKFSTRYTSGGNCYLRFYASLIFFKNFGDVPTP